MALEELFMRNPAGNIERTKSVVNGFNAIKPIFEFDILHVAQLVGQFVVALLLFNFDTLKNITFL